MVTSHEHTHTTLIGRIRPLSLSVEREVVGDRRPRRCPPGRSRRWARARGLARARRCLHRTVVHELEAAPHTSISQRSDPARLVPSAAQLLLPFPWPISGASAVAVVPVVGILFCVCLCRFVSLGVRSRVTLVLANDHLRARALQLSNEIGARFWLLVIKQVNQHLGTMRRTSSWHTSSWMHFHESPRL